MNPAQGSSSAPAWLAHAGLAVTQAAFGGFHVLTKSVLVAGMNPVVFSFYRDTLALAILAATAFVTRRRTNNPRPVTKSLLISFAVLGLTGIYGNQILSLLGLNFTSPAYATAMQPSIPIFTFILAAFLGIESVNLHTNEGWLKLFGTIVSVSGAILMVLYEGPVLIGKAVLKDVNHNGMLKSDGLMERVASQVLGFSIDTWQLGVLCLIGNCSMVSFYFVFQVPVLKRYPDAVAVTAYSYFFGTMLMLLTGLFTANQLQQWTLTKLEIIAVVYAGVVTSSIAYGIMTWANKIVGPTTVAIYCPLQPAMAILLSIIFIGSPLYLGSILGAVFIIAGMYMVTWAQSRETRQECVSNSTPTVDDCWPPTSEG